MEGLARSDLQPAPSLAPTVHRPAMLHPVQLPLPHHNSTLQQDNAHHKPDSVPDQVAVVKSLQTSCSRCSDFPEDACRGRGATWARIARMVQWTWHSHQRRYWMLGSSSSFSSSFSCTKIEVQKMERLSI